MNEKFCFSPWKSNYHQGDSLQPNIKQILKINNSYDFCSVRLSRPLNKVYNDPNLSAKIRINSVNMQEKKQNSQFSLNKIRRDKYRSNENTTHKKSQQKQHNVAKVKNFNFQIDSKSSTFTIRDSHQLLVQKFLKLKKKSKFGIKQRKGSRILLN